MHSEAIVMVGKRQYVLSQRLRGMSRVAWPVGAVLLLSLVACARIQEPWVNNDEEWKEQAFQTESDDDALRHRLRHTQGDR